MNNIYMEICGWRVTYIDNHEDGTVVGYYLGNRPGPVPTHDAPHLIVRMDNGLLRSDYLGRFAIKVMP